MPNAGEIYRHDAFYVDRATGRLMPKFLLLLVVPGNGDYIARLLTSRAVGRRTTPPACDHSDPYPGYCLGIPGGSLTQPTWVDLRALDDLDRYDFHRDLENGRLTLAQGLSEAVLIDVLDCVAGAEDTSGDQERRIRDHAAALRAISS